MEEIFLIIHIPYHFIWHTENTDIFEGKEFIGYRACGVRKKQLSLHFPLCE